MNKYKNGKIYKLVCLTTDKCYIGSTTISLKARLGEHRRHFRCWKNEKRNYLTAFEIFELDNVDIQLIENYPCNSRIELEIKEGEYINNNNCINKNVPGYNIETINNIVYYKKTRLREKEKISCNFCKGDVARYNMKRHLKLVCKENPNNLKTT